MESYLTYTHYDLVTPDGAITELKKLEPKRSLAKIKIEGIAPTFVGYQIEPSRVFFNLKSTLAQLGINGIKRSFHIEKSQNVIWIELELVAIGPIAEAMLDLLDVGCYIGKLFAADERRRVRDPDYLMRMIGRADRKGRPLLSLGTLEGAGELLIEKTEGRTVAFLSVLDGILNYEDSVYGFLPTLAKALNHNFSHTRQLLHLHHRWEKNQPRTVQKNQILLVRTAPLHIRTVYARVVDELLPQGFHHTTANVLQPDTYASGDVYELFGSSPQLLDDIPLEFYTLEPHREHVFFSDRDQLLSSLENPKALFKAFKTAPKPQNTLASVFIVKGEQLQDLKEEDWITREPVKHDFPGLSHPARQAIIVEKYIENQPQYPFLKAIENGLITSQGVLLCRHLPTPLLKRLLLNDLIQPCLKRIYFEFPSASHGNYFSHEDRSMLLDLAKFGIPVYWVDHASDQTLQFILRPDKDAGMFVPLDLVEQFRKSTFFGVYGSNLLGTFETELQELLAGILEMQGTMNHPLLNKNTPLALVTGGGSGAMEVGNRVARNLGILSCANIVGFKGPDVSTAVSEQKVNEYIDIKMTYRLDRLVERQAEFNLDFPIFLPGGIGMDFEYLLEEVRRKTGSCPPYPVLLFGEVEHWKQKVSSRFKANRKTGTTRGSEWVSNCFYCVQTAEQGLSVYRRFFESTLPIGSKGPIYEDGFCIVPEKES